MPVSNGTANSELELEILEIRHDTSEEEEEEDDDQKTETVPPKRHRFRRRNSRRKSNSQSCGGSMYNLTSSRPLYPHQRSEPNVLYTNCGNDSGTVDINLNLEESSNTLDDAPVLESSESLRPSRSNSMQDNLSGSATAHGFRTSFLTVLGKLGVWKSSIAKTSKQIHISETKTSLDTGQDFINRANHPRFRSIFGGML